MVFLIGFYLQVSFLSDTYMNRAIKMGFFLSLWLWIGGISVAQAQVSDIRFKHLSLKQGLSHPSVFCILQDSQGYMWFGTKYGLNFYDGYTIRTYTKKDGLSSEYIQALHEDRDGTLWIGTFDGGLNRFDRRTGKFTAYKNDPQKPTSISSNNIYAIYQDRSNHLWIGTFGGGLCQFDPATQSFKTYQHDPDNPASLSHNDVFSILEDRAGSIWLGTYGGGLCQLDPKTSTFKAYQNDPQDAGSLSRDDVYCLYEDKAGSIWVGTTGGGLCRFDQKTKRFVTYQNNPKNPYSLSSDYVVDIQEDSLGALWIATTKGGGLNRFDPQSGEFHAYVNNNFDLNSISANNLNGLYLDHAGTLWVATDGGGVCKFETQNLAFTTFISDPENLDGFVAGSVTSIYEDKARNIWIGSFENGLYQYDPLRKKYTNYRNVSGQATSLSSDVVKAICEDEEGYVWVGTDENGICRLDRRTGQFTTFTKETDYLSSNSIETLFKDSHGLLWIGTYGGGINVLNPATNELVRYRHEPGNSKSLIGDNIKVIYEDKAGIIWIGTKDAGISRFNPKSKTFTNYQNVKGQNNSLLSNWITAIVEDNQGYIWIGTFDEGLCRLDPRTQSFTRFSTKGGLPDNSICGLLKDHQGRLWVSTLQGLAMLDPRTHQVKTYRVEDGLYSNSFIQWSYHKSQSGELYFGSINNFIRLRPEKLNIHPYVAPIHLTSFNLFNTPQKLDKPLSEQRLVELRPGQNFFSFEFTMLSYLDPEKNQYAYMLEGFDQGWNYIGNRRIAPYTNLDPGDYVFKVKAADKNGVWNETGASIQIIVHPAWYTTWWFRGSVIAAVAGFGFAFYRRRLRQVEEQKTILEDLVQLRTAELIQRNEEIEAQRDSIEATNTILNAAKETIEEQNEELKAINNQLEERVEQRTEELHRAYIKLLESNQELDTFIYRASHDIRGPVARLQGLCKVALMDVEDPKALEYFQMLDQTGEETNQTLVRVLRIYDIRNETVNPQSIQLRSMVERIVTPLQKKYEGTHLEILIPPDLGFLSDVRLLQIILENIIGNAFHYSCQTKTDASVRIEAVAKSGKEISIRVSDNGCGVPEEMQKKLFTMFFKGTHDASGAGLGLYVSKIAAEKLGGQILYQKENCGETTFELQIPNLVAYSAQMAALQTK
jgi:ligand-binding sensor domain-containing protein/signal transduction histidine kinase